MKKFIVLFVTSVLLFATPAFALFNNGGFETGDFSGWDLDFGTVGYGPSITWGAPDHGLYDVIDNTGTMDGQDIDVDPYQGNYMARINNAYGMNHATKISQTDNISQQDIDDGATIFVSWGAMLIEPTNVSHLNEQPIFGINVLVNGTLQDTFTADATAHASDPSWVLAGSSPSSDSGDLWYKHETWEYDLTGFNVGDAVTIEMFVADCGQGGHGGYAFLDGVGTTEIPPNGEVPEPATLLLLGSGLLGILALGRKKFSKQ
jgi:hypothetical protein